MDLRIIFTPDAVGSPPRVTLQKTSARRIDHERTSLRSHSCRTLRSASGSSTIHKSYAASTRRHESDRQPPRSASSHLSSPPLSDDNSLTHRTRASKARLIAKRPRHSSRRRSHAPSPSLLLSQAKRTIEFQAEWFGRKPAIMDVILDLMSPGVDLDEDVLMDIMKRSRMLPSSHREYVFTDRNSVDSYWADQAAIWRDVKTSVLDTKTHFPDSIERSTASWQSALNGGGDESRF